MPYPGDSSRSYKDAQGHIVLTDDVTRDPWDGDVPYDNMGALPATGAGAGEGDEVGPYDDSPVWVAGSYSALTVVSYAGKYWRAVNPTTGTPGVSADWEQL